jgi:hypothetical protein
VSTDDFRQRVEREASAALGVPVALDHVAVDVWPLPAVALSGITVKSKPPLTLAEIVGAHPAVQRVGHHGQQHHHTQSQEHHPFQNFCHAAIVACPQRAPAAKNRRYS